MRLVSVRAFVPALDRSPLDERLIRAFYEWSPLNGGKGFVTKFSEGGYVSNKPLLPVISVLSLDDAAFEINKLLSLPKAWRYVTKEEALLLGIPKGFGRSE